MATPAAGLRGSTVLALKTIAYQTRNLAVPVTSPRLIPLGPSSAPDVVIGTRRLIAQVKVFDSVPAASQWRLLSSGNVIPDTWLAVPLALRWSHAGRLVSTAW